MPKLEGRGARASTLRRTASCQTRPAATTRLPEHPNPGVRQRFMLSTVCFGSALPSPAGARSPNGIELGLLGRTGSCGEGHSRRRHVSGTDPIRALKPPCLSALSLRALRAAEDFIDAVVSGGTIEAVVPLIDGGLPKPKGGDAGARCGGHAQIVATRPPRPSRRGMRPTRPAWCNSARFLTGLHGLAVNTAGVPCNAAWARAWARAAAHVCLPEHEPCCGQVAVQRGRWYGVWTSDGKCDEGVGRQSTPQGSM
eukprot:350380-Chlamydomonas_euryale.AAC.8